MATVTATASDFRSMCSESKKMRIMNINSELPAHIIQIIFSKLPIVNLPFYRFVCKAWNDLVLDYASTSKFVSISNTFFVSSLYRQFVPYMGLGWRSFTMDSIDFDSKHSEGMGVVASFRFDPNWPDFRISNSCNGLLCIIKGRDYRRTCAGILNPMTNEYIQLLGHDVTYREYHFEESDQFYFYGFGFSPKTKEYKVARVSFEVRNEMYYFGTRSCIIEIFTVGKSKEWSCVGCMPCRFHTDGVYSNGALYWVVQDQQWRKVICRLDVENETFEAISFPRFGFVYCEASIGVFRGNLYAILCKSPYFYKFQVWMMRSDGGKYSWIKEFVIDCVPQDWCWRPYERGDLQLIKACEDGKILCLIYGLYLFLYNPKTKRIKILNQDEGRGKTLWVYEIESLNFDSLQKILIGDS